MGLKLIYGCQQDDLEAALDRHLTQDYQSQPNDAFICLVPNHVKFDREVQTLRALGAAIPQQADNGIVASSRIQTLSFSRLLWYFLRDDPMYRRPQLSSSAQAMLLSELLNRYQSDLPIFFGERRRIGFLNQLARQLTEFAQNEFDHDDLQTLTTNLQAQQVPESTTAKLKELHFIYDHYQDEVLAKFITNEQLMSYLIAQVKTRDFSHYHFYLSRFSQFNQQQILLIKAFLQQGATVYLSLYLTPSESLTAENHDYFQHSFQILQQLGYDSPQALPAKDRELVQEKRVSHELQQVEDYWIASNNNQDTSQLDRHLQTDKVQIWQADSITSEIRAVANYIRELVALKHYRYRDFLIVAADLAPYHASIAAIFQQNDIPFFSDEETAMTDHPFATFVQGLLTLSQRGWQLTDLMQVLRTELLIPDDMSVATFRQHLDWLENYALKYGLRPYHWYSEKPWQFEGPYAQPATSTQLDQDDPAVQQQQAQFAAVEQLHQFIAQSLGKWQKQVQQCQTGHEFATALYTLLVQQQVISRLQQWEKAASAAGDLTKAQQPQQTYQAFIDLLDDYVTVWGEQPFDLALFTDLLTAGFANTQFSQIPSTLDNVLCSEFGIIQNQSQKVTIVIGATRANLPRQKEQPSLIDDQERDLINQQSQSLGIPQLAPSLSETAVDLPLRFGRLFLNSHERLIFSFPKNDDHEQKSTVLSPYVQRLQQFFQIPITRFQDRPQSSSRVLDFATSKQGIVGQLLLLARQQKTRGESLPQMWQWVSEQLVKGANASWYQRLFESLDYHNQPVRLTKANVQALYGRRLTTSISRLEDYYMNPYDYFLKYGLRLQKRPLYELDSADTGSFFHDYLDHFIKILQQQDLDLRQLTPKDLAQVNQQLTQSLLDQPEHQMLRGPGQMHYYARRLSKTSAFMTSILQQQAQHTLFKPFRTEIQFGMGDQLAGLVFPLSDGRQLIVRGKIDRLDLAQIDQQDYYQIIDYKSSQHRFDYTRAYYGLSLQLLTYLQSVAQNQAQLKLSSAQPSGAFYLQIADKPFNFAVNKDPQIELLKDHRYQGLLIADPAYLNQLDPQLEKNSPVYPIRYVKRDDAVKVNNSAQGVNRDELTLLLAHNQALITQAAEEIFSGQLRLAPYRLSDTENGLQYSDYRSVMMFDAMLPENRYRDLPKLDKKTMLKQLQYKQRKESEHD